ncbi:unnamed protein product [Rotaria sp. Silwood2]|nr:unnamed protein product [Rotaria sp. Silwood2]CAF4192876.1 unnamed protein product [Rotaria sp. Silwood2]
MVQFTKYFLRLQNYFYENNPSSNSSCTSSPAKWCIDGYDGYKFCIQNPTLLPLCILALLIGLFCSKCISKLAGKFPSRWFYYLAFFLYGIMMTSAGILHCFIGDRQTNEDSSENIRLFIVIIDVSLTTCIAVTFLFCGLCDIQFLNPQSICTRCLLLSSYFILFLLWTLAVINEWNHIIYALYVGVISICCFVYLITQLCIKSNRHALLALFMSGIYASIGLIAESFGAEYICKSEGPFWSQYFGPEFIWCLFANIISEVIPNDSCLVFFVHQKINYENIARLIVRFMLEKLLEDNREKSSVLLESLIEVNESNLRDTVKTTISYGVAYHHSGLTDDGHVELGLASSLNNHLTTSLINMNLENPLHLLYITVLSDLPNMTIGFRQLVDRRLLYEQAEDLRDQAVEVVENIE